MPLPRIVVVPPTFAEIAELARTLAPSGFELVIVRNEHTELEAALATAEYLVCYPNVRTGDAFYRAAPSLRLHQLLSAGYDDVDLEAARRAKVPVSNNGGANAISVAEHAMMLMLMVSRRVISQHANVSSGRWRGNGPAPPRMYEIHGKTLGIIGLGTIGKEVARLARAFGVQVRASLLETLFCCSAGVSLWQTDVLRVPTNVCSWWKSGHAADITANCKRM